jgi:hypothetical protein
MFFFRNDTLLWDFLYNMIVNKFEISFRKWEGV